MSLVDNHKDWQINVHCNLQINLATQLLREDRGASQKMLFGTIRLITEADASGEIV